MTPTYEFDKCVNSRHWKKRKKAVSPFLKKSLKSYFCCLNVTSPNLESCNNHVRIFNPH